MKEKNILILRSIIGGIVILVVAFALSGVLAGQAKAPQRNHASGSKSVMVASANPGTVNFELPVYGKAEAYQRIELFAEVTGVLQNTQPAFLEGTHFSSGQTLLRIEDSEAKAALMSQRSNYINTLTQVLPDLKLDYPSIFADWQNYLASIDVDRSTPPPPNVDDAQAKIFLTSRNVFSSYHNLKSTEERLSKYNIKAPFNGVVTASLIRPGTLVRVGQPLGTFIDPAVYEIEVSVSLRFLDMLKEGNHVTLTSPDVSGEWDGVIDRINKSLDANSQTVKAYIRVKGNTIREGMYLTGIIRGISIDSASSIPRRLIVDNNHIWTVVDSTLNKRPVEIVEFTEYEAIVRGLNAGEIFVTEAVPGAFTGMSVNYIFE